MHAHALLSRTKNGGKKEHVKGPLMGPQIKNYYRGWVMFMKLVRENAGELIIAKDVGDVALFTNSEVRRIRLLAFILFGENVRYAAPRIVSLAS